MSATRQSLLTGLMPKNIYNNSFMNSSFPIWAGMFVGSAIGSYIPTLWGDNMFSLTSIILSAVLAVVGVWIGFKLSNN